MSGPFYQNDCIKWYRGWNYVHMIIAIIDVSVFNVDIINQIKNPGVIYNVQIF